MFYLLEEKRIIDSEELSNSGIRINIKENVMYLDSWLGTRFFGTIKKQSENVYDLIEVGDLVKTLGIFRVDVINTPLKQIYSFLDRESTMVINMLGVKAIYKPDEKGNYIKVWEVEDE